MEHLGLAAAGFAFFDEVPEAVEWIGEADRWTKTHNTILVNGRGQLGEGQTWFDRDSVMQAGASSAIVKAEAGEAYDYIVGDAGNIYPESAALTRFHRHLLYIKPDITVIVDDLGAERPAQFEWLLHTEIGFERRGDRYCVAVNGDVAMDVHLLHPEGVYSRVEGRTLKACTEPITGARFAAVLHPRRVDRTASSAHLVSFRNGKLKLEVESGDRRAVVNLDLVRQQVDVFSEILSVTGGTYE